MADLRGLPVRTRWLLEILNGRGVKVGVATSIRRGDLEADQIFPTVGPNSPLRLTPGQPQLLSLFA